MKLFSLAATTFLLCSCGTNTPGRTTDTLSLQGEEFVFLESGSLQSSGGAISGSGKLVAKNPRPKEDSHFSLAFTLKDLGSLGLTTNANSGLGSGVHLSFVRKGSQLAVRVKVGDEDYDVSSDFASVDAAQPLSFEMEVHAHGHVIVWVGSEKMEYAFSTRVSERLWGLTLKDAAFTKATASEATEIHG